MRFFAALAVVLFHVCGYLRPLRGGLQVLGLGYAGVTFFFALSGFVLAWSYRTGDRAARFYTRRFARVWPLHALTWALAIPVMLAEGRPLGIPVAVAVLILVQAWVPKAEYYYGYNQASWSLSCEAFFYALFPFVVARVANRPPRSLARAGTAIFAVVGLAVVVVVGAGRSGSWLLYIDPLYRLGEFVLGMLLAYAIRAGMRLPGRVTHASAALAVTYVALLIIARAAYGDVTQLASPITDTSLLLPLLWLIGAAAQSDLDGRRTPLLRPALIHLGQWSFALYLIHELVLRVSRRVVPHPSVTGSLAVGAAGIAIAIALSASLYLLYERPVEVRIKSRFTGDASAAV